ncbi:MAG: hypothetical protein ISQ19_02565 [PS1 clade bacterium]|uniref:Cadherin domain-containing protein n=1 Tax=PS1 clade bacterium TaxID=2175152 RepID=A0A937HH73_9PROT|nr:hypothetical protein [PS1 clade bacterium]
MFFDRLFKLQSLKFHLLGSTSFVQNAQQFSPGKFRKEGAMLSPLIAGLLAACGSGSSDYTVLVLRDGPGSTEGGDRELPPQPDFTVSVADGPIWGARIYTDDGEHVGTTDENGQAQILIEHEGKVLSVDLTGAFDTYTGEEFESGTYTLDTSDLTVASPISTMIVELIKVEDNEITTAEEAIAAIFDNDAITPEHLNDIENYKTPAEDGSPEAIQNTVSTSSIFLQHYAELRSELPDESEVPSIEEFVTANDGLPADAVSEDLDDFESIVDGVIAEARERAQGEPVANPDITRGDNTADTMDEDTAIAIELEDWGFLDPAENTEGESPSAFASVSITGITLARTEEAASLPTSAGDTLGTFTLASGEKIVVQSDGSGGYTAEHFGVDGSGNLNDDATAAFPEEYGTATAITFSNDALADLEFMLDENQFGTVIITFTVNDGERDSDEAALTLTVNDINDEAPVFTSPGTATALAENTGAGQVVYTAAATPDVAGDTVAYSLGGTDASLFSINADTGAVTLTGDPDFETKSSYAFDVTATVGGQSATQSVTLEITDANDEAPVFTSLGTATALAENSGAGQVVYTAAATPDVATDNVVYSLGGTDASLFSINADTALWSVFRMMAIWWSPVSNKVSAAATPKATI